MACPPVDESSSVTVTRSQAHTSRIRSSTVATMRGVSTDESTAWSASAAAASDLNCRAICSAILLNDSARSANSSLLEIFTGSSNCWLARRCVPFLQRVQWREVAAQQAQRQEQRCSERRECHPGEGPAELGHRRHRGGAALAQHQRPRQGRRSPPARRSASTPRGRTRRPRPTRTCRCCRCQECVPPSAGMDDVALDRAEQHLARSIDDVQLHGRDQRILFRRAPQVLVVDLRRPACRARRAMC